MDAKKYRDIVYRIIGASMAVYDELSWGLLEGVYEEALSMELKSQGIDNERQQEVTIYYKGETLQKRYKMDLVVGDVIVELKSASAICAAHRAQLCNYLRLTHKPVGVLINFGAPRIQGERWIYDIETNECTLVDKAMNPVYWEEDPLTDVTDSDEQ